MDKKLVDVNPIWFIFGNLRYLIVIQVIWNEKKKMIIKLLQNHNFRPNSSTFDTALAVFYFKIEFYLLEEPMWGGRFAPQGQNCLLKSPEIPWTAYKGLMTFFGTKWRFSKYWVSKLNSKYSGRITATDKCLEEFTLNFKNHGSNLKRQLL